MDCYYCSQIGDAYRVFSVQPYSCTVAHGSSVQLYIMSVNLLVDLTGCLEYLIVVCRVYMPYDLRSYGMSLTTVNSHLSITKDISTVLQYYSTAILQYYSTRDISPGTGKDAHR